MLGLADDTLPFVKRRTLLAALGLSVHAGFGQKPAPAWVPLFDGKTLAGWTPSGFKGEGPIKVENGAIVLGLGGPMSGVTRTAPVAEISAAGASFEIQFEAKRLQGGDFFASLTFPAGGDHCTWVTGGWGGDIVGLSNIDGWDASDNETRSYFNFESDRWYRFRIQVGPKKILAWIDDQPIINVNIAGRQISLRRGEMNLSSPLGFASYNTSGAIRAIAYRVLSK